MNLSIFAIYDQAVKSYNQPWFVQSKDLGTRLFIQQVNQDPKATIYTSAEQFVLYYLGQYDDESAEFQLITPEAVMRASDCKDPEVGKRQTYEEQLEEIIHQVEAWQKKVDKEMADHGTTIHEIRNIVYRMEQANNE